MGEMDHVTVGEFSRFAQSIERQLAAGFKQNTEEIRAVSTAVSNRLDRVEDEQNEQGRKLAVLEDRQKRANGSASKWGGTIGAAAGAIVVALLNALGISK